MPVAIPFGATLHAEQVGNLLYYAVTKNTNAANFKQLYVVAKRGAVKLYEAMLDMGEASKAVNKIPLDSLTNGLLELTLQDANKRTIQERVVLVNYTKNQPYIIQTEVNSTPKAKNVFELTLPDNLKYNLSASIADLNFYDKTSTPDIQNQFWFSDDMKAFSPDVNKALQTNNTNAIDLMMLTNGWRKYNINSVNQLQADNYLTLIVNYKEKNYALPKNEKLILVINDTFLGKKFYDVEQTTQTSFEKSGLVFYDSASIYYKTNKSKEIENFLSLQRERKSFLPLTINPATVKSYQTPQIQSTTTHVAIGNFFPNDDLIKNRKFNETQTIKSVVVKSKKYGNPVTLRTLELDKTYTSGMFSGIARGYQINVLDDEKAWGSSDTYSYIINVLPMLKTTGSIGNRKLVNRFKAELEKDFSPILIFVNETEWQHGDLESISVSQLAYIKYVEGIVIGSSFTTNNGALYIYLKKGNEPTKSALPEMRKKTIKGYDIAKDFSTPDYSDKSNLLQKDIRTTVYWNPYIITDKANNKVKIEYYNNDISKKLLLTIEGFNEEGNLIHIEKVIE